MPQSRTRLRGLRIRFGVGQRTDHVYPRNAGPTIFSTTAPPARGQSVRSRCQTSDIEKSTRRGISRPSVRAPEIPRQRPDRWPLLTLGTVGTSVSTRNPWRVGRQDSKLEMAEIHWSNCRPSMCSLPRTEPSAPGSHTSRERRPSLHRGGVQRDLAARDGPVVGPNPRGQELGPLTRRGQPPAEGTDRGNNKPKSVS
jgi:hypothetical protein